MYRQLKVSHNNILRRLLGVPRCTSARTLFINTRQDNVDVLNRKQCYNLKLRNEGFFDSFFDLFTFKALNLFAKWRDNNEVTGIHCCLVLSLDLSNKSDLLFVSYMDRNK